MKKSSVAKIKLSDIDHSKAKFLKNYLLKMMDIYSEIDKIKLIFEFLVQKMTQE